MIANENRILALREIGYTTREAEFLCLAAVFSGFFLRRQYCQFINRGSGYPVDQLAKKLIGRGHAREIHTDRRTLLYHLCSRPLYAAIG